MCECATSTERFRVFLPSVECLTLYRFSMIAQDDISYKLVRGFECYILRRLPFFFFFFLFIVHQHVPVATASLLFPLK